MALTIQQNINQFSIQVDRLNWVESLVLGKKNFIKWVCLISCTYFNEHHSYKYCYFPETMNN